MPHLRSNLPTNLSTRKELLFFISWSKRLLKVPKGIAHTPPTLVRTISPETRNALLSAIARARRWIVDIESGAVDSISEIAKQGDNVEWHIRLLLPLAFAPLHLIESLAVGNAPRDITVTGLAKRIPLQW